MKRTYICVIAIILFLSGCNNTIPIESQEKSDQLSVSEPLSIIEDDEFEDETIPENEVEPSAVPNTEKPNTEFVEVGEFLDLGALLWPEASFKGINGQFLDGGILYVWGADKTIRYDYYSNIILQEYDAKIIPLGMNHYYSCTQQEDSTWLAALYDKELQVLSEFSYHKPVMLSIDGNCAVSVDKSIEVIDVKSGDTNIYELSSMSDYQGSIYNSIFDGKKVYFSATLNPFPGNGAIGYYDVLTGELTIFDDISAQFAGLPEYVGENEVWYWQDGSAYGTDGTYCILLNSENGSITKYDVNDATCKMSSNKIVSVQADDRKTGYDKIEAFKIYDSNNTDLYQIYPVSNIDSLLYRATDKGIAISSDEKYICIYGFKETTEPYIFESSLYLYRVS